MGATTMNKRSAKEWEDDGRHYANKKFYGADFSKRDLSNADFRGAEIIECDFTEATLIGAKFMGANCFGSNFTRAKLLKANFMGAILTRANFNASDMRQVTITLGCDTFEDIKLPDKWLKGLLYMISLADIPTEDQQKLHDIIGEKELKLWQMSRMAL